MSDEALEALRTNTSSRKTFEGYDNYQMLRSLLYQTAFQYQSIDNRNEASDYALSDVVTKFLYLGKNYQHQQDDNQLSQAERNSSLQNSLRNSPATTKAQHVALIKARKSKMMKMMAKKME